MGREIPFRDVYRVGGDLLPAQCDLAHAREDALKPARPWAYKTSTVGPRLE